MGRQKCGGIRRSYLASIIFATMPVAVLITSVWYLNEKTNYIQCLGLTIAVLALAAIIFEESRSNTEAHWWGIISLVVAVIIHAVIYTQVKKKCLTVSVITFNTLPCLFAGLILTVVGYLYEDPQIEKFSMYSICSTFYLGAFAGVFGILCYFSLQKIATAFQASLVFLIFPLIAVASESYTYGHAISMFSMLLVAPLTIGILLTLISKNHNRKGKPLNK